MKIFIILLTVLFTLISSSVSNAQTENPRMVILADMGNEPDEEQQILHLLLYANEIDIEGLIAVTGKYLNPSSSDPYKQVLHPELFMNIIDGYGRVVDNLKLHASGWSSPDYQWTKIETEGEVTDRHENTFSADHDWETLFNGENLDGWQVKCQEQDAGNTFWSVDEDKGAIICNSIGSKDHGYVWLMHEKEFDDFELRLKFKVSRENNGNSGVQVRSRYDEEAIVDENGHAGWLDGPQVDIDPSNPWRIGLIYDETRETRRWINPSLPDWKIDKDAHAPEKVIFYWEDEETGWNDMTIICRGTRIKTIVNNVVVSDYDGAGVLDDKAHEKHDIGMSGNIALQLHKNSENKIWFKDIKIRDIQ